ncbi:MAG: ABC transporter permease [Actinobacteria bacterium]|nr:ABC transporter permease [Actinomycetota bacterium]
MNAKSGFKKIFTDKVIVSFIIVVVLFIIGEIAVPGFAAFNHIMTVLQTSFFLGMLSLGQTVVVISGKEGIDLSVGPMLTVGVITSSAILMGKDSNFALALVVVLALGFTLGLVNGAGISFLGIAPLIMTLAWGIVVEGSLLFITNGFPPGKASPLLELLGGGSLKFNLGSYLVEIPWVIIIWIVITLIVLYVFKRTTLGRIFYGIGTNDRAANLLGIRTKQFRMLSYGFSGMFSAFSGMLLLGYVTNPNLNLGINYGLPSIAAIVIGGISLAGGAGSYLGAVAGAIILSTLASILVTFQFGESGRQIIFGFVLLILLVLYARKNLSRDTKQINYFKS